MLLLQFSSVAQSCLTLWPDGLQHSRPPCLSPTPGVYWNSCPLTGWCHPTISSSVVPFSSCLQSFPASGSFQMSQFFTSGGQRFEFQLQHQTYQWTLRTDLWDGLDGSPCSPRDFQESSPTPQFKSINSSALSFLYSPTLASIHDHRKNHSLDEMDLVGKVMSLLLNMLSRLVITFLPRSKHLNFMAAVTICSDFGDQKNKVCLWFPIYFPWSDGTGCHDLSFLNVAF